MKAMCLFYPEANKKMKLLCTYLSEKLEGKADRVPPAYNPENQRLVIIAIKQGKDPTDEIVRFCRELNKKRALNVAFVFDAPSETQTTIMNASREAGTNVIGDVLTLEAGGISLFTKFTDEDKKKADEWLDKIQPQLVG